MEREKKTGTKGLGDQTETENADREITTSDDRRSIGKIQRERNDRIWMTEK